MRKIIEILMSNNAYCNFEALLQDININYKKENSRITSGLVSSYDEFMKWVDYDIAYIKAWTNSKFVRKYINTCSLILRTFNISGLLFDNLNKQIYKIPKNILRFICRSCYQKIRYNEEIITAKYDDTLFEIILKLKTQSKIYHTIEKFVGDKK